MHNAEVYLSIYLWYSPLIIPSTIVARAERERSCLRSELRGRACDLLGVVNSGLSGKQKSGEVVS